jgi:bacterioferritin-associated ferredoxin
MIVCSCNVLTDHDVRSAVSAAEDLPRNAKQLYGCLGCSAECGRCARTIKTIIDEALALAPRPAVPDARTARPRVTRTSMPGFRSKPPPENPKIRWISAFPAGFGGRLALASDLI